MLSLRLIHRMTAVLMLAWGIVCIPTNGQELIDLYRDARFRIQTENFFEERGLYAEPLEAEHIPSRADTLQQWLNQLSRIARIAAWNRRQKHFEIEEWRLVRRLERSWFAKKFENTMWAYLGAESLTPIDTTMTRDLRARMESYFGPPTQTVAELVNSEQGWRTRDRFVQFEYWFVVNDSIPIVLMDFNGPLERGLITSTDQRYRDILLSVRESFLKEFWQADGRAPYVDYYYDVSTLTWHYSGFDGTNYFMEPIVQPNLSLGRPWLEILNRSD